MTPTRWVSTLDAATVRVRGRWVISVQAFVVGVTLHAALIAGTGGSVGAEPTSLRESPYWLALALVASSMVGLFALVVNDTAFRHKRQVPVPLWQAVAFHASVGVIFAASLIIGSQVLPVQPIDEPLGFTIATIAIGLWFGFTMSYILEARDTYHRRRRELIDQSVRWELASIAQTEVAVALQTRLRREVGQSLSDLEPIRADLLERLNHAQMSAQGLIPDATWWDVAHRLREAAHRSVRPLSRELWNVTQEVYPDPRWREVVFDTLRRPIASPIASALIIVIGYLRAGMESFGIAGGVTATLSFAVLVAGALTAIRRLPAGRPRSAGFWGVFLLAQLAGLAFASDSPTEILGSIIAMSISILGPSIVATLNDSRSEVLDRLGTETARERIRQIAQATHLAGVARDTARHLHGTVQTVLVACAAAIEQATESSDPSQLWSAIERAIEVLDTVDTDMQADPHHLDVVGLVERATAPWIGLVEVRSHVDGCAANLRGQTALAVGRVVEECVANAVRHGDATEVAVFVRCEENTVVVIVEDDGLGLRAGAPGLGTAVLMDATHGALLREAMHPTQARTGLRVTATLSLDPGERPAPRGSDPRP